MTRKYTHFTGVAADRDGFAVGKHKQEVPIIGPNGEIYSPVISDEEVVLPPCGMTVTYYNGSNWVTRDSDGNFVDGSAAELATTVTLTGGTPVEEDNAIGVSENTAALNKANAGCPVVFTLATFLAADIEAVSVGTIADLLDGGVTVYTDDSGEAELDITFKADVDKSGVLTAAITGADHYLLGANDTDTETIVVDTTAD